MAAILSITLFPLFHCSLSLAVDCNGYYQIIPLPLADKDLLLSLAQIISIPWILRMASLKVSSNIYLSDCHKTVIYSYSHVCWIPSRLTCPFSTFQWHLTAEGMVLFTLHDALHAGCDHLFMAVLHASHFIETEVRSGGLTWFSSIVLASYSSQATTGQSAVTPSVYVLQDSTTRDFLINLLLLHKEVIQRSQCMPWFLIVRKKKKKGAGHTTDLPPW